MNKKIFLVSLSLVLIFAIFAMPVASFAQTSKTGLVPCGTGNKDAPTTNKDCEFKDLLTLVNNVINFILKNLVIPIAAIMMAYAGFILLTAGGEAASKVTKAKEIFTNVIIGLVISLGAWLAVKTVLTALGYQYGSLIGF